MEEKYINLFVGLLLIITNKYLAMGFIWWEREVVRLFQDSLNQWFYRIPIIVMGLFFTSIFFFKD
jgi:hypothetical protein